MKYGKMIKRQEKILAKYPHIYCEEDLPDEALNQVENIKMYENLSLDITRYLSNISPTHKIKNKTLYLGKGAN